MPQDPHHLSALFVELGLVIVGLAVLARLAKRYGISAIPFYLLAGLAFGKGGLAPLNVSEDFNRVGSEIGVLLLLFILGLEYTGEELSRNLKAGFASGAIDLILNYSWIDCRIIAGMEPLSRYAVRWRHLHFVFRNHREGAG